MIEKETISMWDIETKTRFNIVPLPSSMLELESLQIGGKPYLVILAVNGMHHFFRCSSEDNLSRDGNYEVLAHPGLENDQKHGVLTALDNVVASSVGTGIYVRDIANQGWVLIIDFPQKYTITLFKQGPLISILASFSERS